MAPAPKPYRRLPGASSSAFEYLRLYLTADHLLLVSSSGFHESYRRFFFRDIQAFTIRRTSARLWWNIGFAVPLGLCALVLLIGGSDIFQRGFQPNDVAALIAFGLPALILLSFIVVNTVRGPACVCQVQTAVQTRRLPTLGRIRNARRVIDQIMPLIHAAQESLPPEEIARRIDLARQGTVPVPDAPSVMTSPTPSPDGISFDDVPPSPQS